MFRALPNTGAVHQDRHGLLAALPDRQFHRFHIATGGRHQTTTEADQSVAHLFLRADASGSYLRYLCPCGSKLFDVLHEFGAGGIQSIASVLRVFILQGGGGNQNGTTNTNGCYLINFWC